MRRCVRQLSLWTFGGFLTANGAKSYRRVCRQIKLLPGLRVFCYGFFGVLPPISKLTTAQAMYYFLSGYTSKLAGTEAGVTTPQATFSSCFGAAFLPLRPGEYANLLRERIEKYKVRCYLINTGWSGGPFGIGERININYTRAMVRAAISGALDEVEMFTDPVFGLSSPTTCPDVPSEVLIPRNTWADKEAYDRQATDLATRFKKNFTQFTLPSDEVRNAGPK